jgi:O-antigen/teichoic acid export membrane protein
VLTLVRGLSRAGWGLADQALSSLTNFALGIFVARTVGVEEFGAFSLVFAVYLLLMSVCRAFPMEPLQIRYSGQPDETIRSASRRAVGSVFAIGVAASIALLPIAFAFGGSIGGTLLALAVTLPGLLVQDAWRSAFFAWHRGSSAFANDLLWALVMVTGLVWLTTQGAGTAMAATFIWGISATLAAIFGIWQTRVVPDPRRTLDWWREHIDLGPRFIAEVLSRIAGTQVALYGIGLAAGLAALGSLRAAQLVVGPVQILFLGIGLIAVPEGVRALSHSRGRLVRLAVLMSVGLAIAGLAWGLVALLLPEAVGEFVLGAAWAPAQEVLAPVIIAQLGILAAAGAGMGLRTLAAARRSLRANLLVSALIVTLGIGGSLVGGTLGAAWGLALAGLLGTLIWWKAFRDELASSANRPDGRATAVAQSGGGTGGGRSSGGLAGDVGSGKTA